MFYLHLLNPTLGHQYILDNLIVDFDVGKPEDDVMGNSELLGPSQEVDEEKSTKTLLMIFPNHS